MKNILITGGSGSLGRALIEQILRQEPPLRLTILGHDDRKHLDPLFKNPPLRYSVADIRLKERLTEIISGHDYVIHAAALRDLVACEKAPWEAFQTNVVGTRHVLEAAREAKVAKVLFISSDKAVNPRSVYGTTKLMGERMATQAQTPDTKVASIRFGGLLENRSGIVKKLLEQKRTGLIHVTDPQMSRFTMPIHLAARHILRAIETMEGGEVFVPKSPAVKLMDLVHTLAPATKIQFIGAQPGERLHDILLSEEEGTDSIEREDHYVIRHGSRNGQLRSGFAYQSNTSTWALTHQEIRSIAQLPPA